MLPFEDILSLRNFLLSSKKLLFCSFSYSLTLSKQKNKNTHALHVKIWAVFSYCTFGTGKIFFFVMKQ